MTELFLHYFEDFIQELLRGSGRDTPRGPPAASDTAIDAVPSRSVKDDDTDIKNDCCLVCQENFQVDEQIATLDCGHHFHPDCIKPWLKRANSCPTCRTPITDDSPPPRQPEEFHLMFVQVQPRRSATSGSRGVRAPLLSFGSGPPGSGLQVEMVCEDGHPLQPDQRTSSSAAPASQDPIQTPSPPWDGTFGGSVSTVGYSPQAIGSAGRQGAGAGGGMPDPALGRGNCRPSRRHTRFANDPSAAGDHSPEGTPSPPTQPSPSSPDTQPPSPFDLTSTALSSLFRYEGTFALSANGLRSLTSPGAPPMPGNLQSILHRGESPVPPSPQGQMHRGTPPPPPVPPGAPFGSPISMLQCPLFAPESRLGATLADLSNPLQFMRGRQAQPLSPPPQQVPQAPAFPGSPPGMVPPRAGLGVHCLGPWGQLDETRWTNQRIPGGMESRNDMVVWDRSGRRSHDAYYTRLQARGAQHQGREQQQQWARDGRGQHGRGEGPQRHRSPQRSSRDATGSRHRSRSPRRNRGHRHGQ